jgi:hypothetical protein
LSGSFTRTDLFLVVFCIVDDWMRAHYGGSSVPRRRGVRQPLFSDAEVLTVLLVAELCHCRRELAWHRQVSRSYRALFPHLPEYSRFTRRAVRVASLLRHLRRQVLFWADADLEAFRIVDSFPLPSCACYRLLQSTLPLSGSTFGFNKSKNQYYWGLHPALVITASGFVEDLVLAPGNLHDVPLLTAYLEECVREGRNLRGQTWILDKGFASEPLRRTAWEALGLRLVARQKQRKEEQGLPLPCAQQMIDTVRKPIETLLAVLRECLGLQDLRVKTDLGLYRRTQAKATACALASYFNRALGRPVAQFACYAV